MCFLILLLCYREVLNASICDVFRLLFQRLQSSKTVKYVKGLLTFFSFYVIKYGASSFIQLIDSIQPNMFGMLMDRIFTPELQKISGNKDKKICAVGVTKILCEAPETFSEQYLKYWYEKMSYLNCNKTTQSNN